MKDIVYQNGGALLASSPVYIERSADQVAFFHMQRMDYISLVDPRQQGKTSLMNRISQEFKNQGNLFAYLDLTTGNKKTESSWYCSLYEWILKQVDESLPKENLPIPSDGNSWYVFLCELAEQITKLEKKIIIALDEVGATPKEWATDFFSSIRSIYNSRQNIPGLNNITFIVAGAYNPRELIRDRSVSSFNVSHRIPIPDFDINQIQKLVNFLNIGSDGDKVAERIFFWTSGQPYICQMICMYLSTATTVTSILVDDAVDKFFREDTNHLPRLLSDLYLEPELLKYTKKSIASRPKMNPSINDWQFNLAYEIGIASVDGDGRFQIRNQIYLRALETLNSDTIPFLEKDDLEISINQLEVSSLKKQLLQLSQHYFALQEKKSSFLDPRSIPIDLTESEQLILHEIHRVKSRLSELGE